MACLAARVYIFCRRESKSSERREKEKRTTLSRRFRSAGHFRESDNRSEGQEGDDVYQQTVRTFNAYFRVQENAAYERHVLR